MVLNDGQFDCVSVYSRMRLLTPCPVTAGYQTIGVAAGCIPAVIQAMKSHPTDVSIQTAGCLALWNLAQADGLLCLSLFHYHILVNFAYACLDGIRRNQQS